MVSNLDVCNFNSQYIDPVDFSSMPKCSYLPGFLSCFSVERRSCYISYSFTLPFSAVSLDPYYILVDLTVELFPF